MQIIKTSKKVKLKTLMTKLFMGLDTWEIDIIKHGIMENLQKSIIHGAIC